MSAPATAEPTGKDSPARRAFVPVVLVGLASTAAAAFAGHQSMLRVPDADLSKLGVISATGTDAARAEFPLAGALALVAIACWGVILVTRGKIRQAVAALAALAAGGTFAVLVVGGFLERSNARSDMADQLGVSIIADQLPISWTPWFWVALVASVLSVAAAVSAVLYAAEWPEMGSKYDAPTSHDAKATDAPPEERTSLDLWKSMDEGDDPTDDPDHTDD